VGVGLVRLMSSCGMVRKDRSTQCSVEAVAGGALQVGVVVAMLLVVAMGYGVGHKGGFM